MAATFRIPAPPKIGAPAAWGLALALPAGAYAVEVMLRSLMEPIPFVLFFLAVAVVSSVGGMRRALLAIAASSALGYLFLRGSASAVRATDAGVGTAVFLSVALAIAALGAAARAGFAERERATDALARREAELAHALKGRDAFLAVASHELKTPITSLQLVLQTIARRGDGAVVLADELGPKLATIQRQVVRLARVVDDLLEVSRIPSGRLRLELEVVDLEDVAREVAKRFQAELEKSGSKLTIEARAPVRGRWDRARVEQVVTNLLANAIKYGTGCPVRMAIEAREGRARLVVADRGIGIAPEDHARIFECFERGAAATGYGGFGVGLWITREIVTRLGGAISVESAPGRGAIFTVELPALRESAARGEAEAVAEA